VKRLLLVLVLVAGCTDLRMDPAVNHIQTVIADPSFKNDLMPVLRATCGSSGACHGSESPIFGLDLENDSLAYLNLVGHASTNGPMPRVTPGKPDSSWMYRVLSTDPTYRLGYYRMPLTEYALPFETRETIKNWITKGALNN
jgi:hypothetical protein